MKIIFYSRFFFRRYWVCPISICVSHDSLVSLIYYKLVKNLELSAWGSAAVFSGLLLLLVFLTNIVNWQAFITYFLIGMAMGVILSTVELMALNPLPTRLLATGNGLIISSMQAGYGISAFIAPLLFVKFGIHSLIVYVIIINVTILIYFYIGDKYLNVNKLVKNYKDL